VTAVKVDVFVAGADPFDIERPARRHRARLSADPVRELFVDTAEYRWAARLGVTDLLERARREAGQP
jgi:hypothetical protein